MLLKLSIDVSEKPNGGFEPVIKISGLDVAGSSDDVRDRLIKLFLEQNGDSLMFISYSGCGSEAIIRRVEHLEGCGGDASITMSFS